MSIYDYAAEPLAFQVNKVAGTSLRVHYEVTFPSPHASPWRPADTVFGEFFTPPTAGRVPLVILSHGFGDASLAPCLTLARLLVKQGLAVFVLYSPVHTRRLPRESQGQGFQPTLQTWLDVYQAAVKEIRRVVDWACTREEINPDKISVAGISMGGMISSIAMAVDRRIQAGIFIVIGGNMEELSWGGASGVVPAGHTCSRQECHAVYSRYPAFLEEMARKGLENTVPAKECFLFDPFTFASRLRERPVLMINARDDEIVSAKATTDLWEAWGKPPLVWLEGNHATSYAQAAAIGKEITSFLGAAKT